MLLGFKTDENILHIVYGVDIVPGDWGLGQALVIPGPHYGVLVLRLFPADVVNLGSRLVE